MNSEASRVSPIVSRAGAADAPAIRELLSRASSSFDVDAELARPYAKLWLARSAPQQAAHGVVLAWQVLDELEVIDLYVAASARRRGLGRALMGALIRFGQEQSLARVLLEVRRDNHAAQQLYFQLGFALDGERRAYYADGEDALLLGLRLREEDSCVA